MKFKRMMDKIGQFLSAERREQEEKRKKLKELLGKMKNERKSIEAEIADCDDDRKRADLLLKLSILNEQRKKGIALHRELAGKGKRMDDSA